MVAAVAAERTVMADTRAGAALLRGRSGASVAAEGPGMENAGGGWPPACWCECRLLLAVCSGYSGLRLIDSSQRLPR